MLKFFLEERSSVGLSLFRFAVAFTVGAHLIPTLLHLDDNYLHTAFKEKNLSFFTLPVVALVDKSPDWLVIVVTTLFLISWAFYFVGFLTQISCILMVACCYYFYALNSLHIGTLSYDILLVTLSLMVVTPYAGDYFSIDALIKKIPFQDRPKRPFFVQALLQMQIASTFFYTGLCKFTGEGNWLTDNPIYYLVNSTAESVVKQFPLREAVASHPLMCYGIGIFVIVSELLMPVLLYWKRTRILGMAYGFLFHVLLLVTLHVPTIFFFLFPPQLLLFIEPESAEAWFLKIKKRAYAAF